MKNYYTKDNEIIENQTGLRIKICKDSNKAKKECNEFNLGKGFDGWTPAYILEQITTFG